MSMSLVITSIGYIIIVFSIVMLVKNYNTYNNMMKITEAIHSYNIHKLHEANTLEELEHLQLISYDCAKSYNSAYWNLRDWGYENLVPIDILEKIKPFIG